MNNKLSEYNRNYYIKNRERIIQKRLDYYRENQQMINQRNKEYYVNYYQQNKQKIITRVQNNYHNKIHAVKVYKPVIIPKTNDKVMDFTKPVVLLDNNIIIRLMD